MNIRQWRWPPAKFYRKIVSLQVKMAFKIIFAGSYFWCLKCVWDVWNIWEIRGREGNLNYTCAFMIEVIEKSWRFQLFLDMPASHHFPLVDLKKHWLQWYHDRNLSPFHRAGKLTVVPSSSVPPSHPSHPYSPINWQRCRFLAGLLQNLAQLQTAGAAFEKRGLSQQ